MKKFFALSIAAALLFSFSGCKYSNGQETSSLMSSTPNEQVSNIVPKEETSSNSTPIKLEKLVYSYTVETTTYAPEQTDPDEEPAAPGINYEEINFETCFYSSYGGCIDGDVLRDYIKENPDTDSQEWFNSPIYYNGKDYYPWLTGTASPFTYEIKDNTIELDSGVGVFMVLEILSDGTLRSTSEYDNGKIFS